MVLFRSLSCLLHLWSMLSTLADKMGERGMKRGGEVTEARRVEERERKREMEREKDRERERGRGRVRGREREREREKEKKKTEEESTVKDYILKKHHCFLKQSFLFLHKPLKLQPQQIYSGYSLDCVLLQSWPSYPMHELQPVKNSVWRWRTLEQGSP